MIKVLDIAYARFSAPDLDAMEKFVNDFGLQVTARQPDALYALGLCYREGLGVTPDLTEAARWYRRAASLGHVDAMHNLATAYHRGDGVPVSAEKALRWYRRAAT